MKKELEIQKYITQKRVNNREYKYKTVYNCIFIVI